MNPKTSYKKFPHIRTIKSFENLISGHYSLVNSTIIGLDFTELAINWDALKIENTSFLGCSFSPEDLYKIVLKGATVFPKSTTIPYNPYRTALYTYETLNRPTKNSYVDKGIYDHFSHYRFRPSVQEELWQRIHDHGIDTALAALLEQHDSNTDAPKKIIGIMGGHSTSRDSEAFLQCALLCHKLTQNGYYIVTGGGPGIMEAANMGAYFAQYSTDDLIHAIQSIKEAPKYSDPGFQELAISCRNSYPNGSESLDIPTWFYGHEPSNVFSTYIAKYFSNSIREDTLLAISIQGVIYCPGSAGTVQEIFADAAQNHYRTYGWVSPMIFFNESYFTNTLPVDKLLTNLSSGKSYSDKILFSDSQDEIIQFLKDNPAENPN